MISESRFAVTNMSLAAFGHLPAELRNLVYEEACSFDSRPLIAVIPDPCTPWIPRSLQPSEQCAIWRAPIETDNLALKVSGLTQTHWQCEDAGGVSHQYFKVNARLPPRLYLLCREIYNIAIPVFYSSLIFGFWSVQGLEHFPDRTTSLACSSIRHLIVDIELRLPSDCDAHLEHDDEDTKRNASPAISDYFVTWRDIWD
jgi:hypothetical protein